MLSVQEIKKFIDDDKTSEKKRLAALGQRYKDGEHDILHKRLFYFNADGKLVEDKTRSNIKISHPFFAILTEQLSAYMLSFKENPIRAKEEANGLQDYLDTYFDDEFWAEIGELIEGGYAKGFEYLYAYKNEEDRLAFQCADSLGVVEVPAKYSSDKKDYKIYHYTDTELTKKGRNTVTRIQVWDSDNTYFYVQDSKEGKVTLDKSVAVNPRPHIVYVDEETGEKTGSTLGFIPFWRLDNNKKQTSGLKVVKPIIDDYDLHACSLSNNLVDFDTPLHVVSGFQGDNLDELQTNLKTKKIIGVDENGGVEVKTIDVPYQARKEKMEVDEKNIFVFGMGFNPSQVGDGNITNIVIKSRYTLLDLKAGKMEKRLKKLLKEIIKVVLDEINSANCTQYEMKHIKFEFTREVMTNETENIANEKVKAETRQLVINTILNVAAQIGDEQALQMICDELDIDFDEIKGELDKIQEEKSLADAKNTLNSVAVEGDEPTDPTITE